MKEKRKFSVEWFAYAYSFTQLLVIRKDKKVCSNYIVSIYLFNVWNTKVCRELGFVVLFFNLCGLMFSDGAMMLHFSCTRKYFKLSWNFITIWPCLWLPLSLYFTIVCTRTIGYILFLLSREKGIRPISRKAHHLSSSIIIVTGILFTFSSLKRYCIVHIKDLFTFVKYNATYFWVA